MLFISRFFGYTHVDNETVEEDKHYVFYTGSESQDLKFEYNIENSGELSDVGSDIFEYMTECRMNCYLQDELQLQFEDLRIRFYISADRKNNAIIEARCVTETYIHFEYRVINAFEKSIYNDHPIRALRSQLFEEILIHVYKNVKKHLKIKDNNSKLKYVDSLTQFTDENVICEI